MLHHVMPVWWSLTPFPAGNNVGTNQPSVVENRGIERLMRPSNYAGHFDEVIWGWAFDALHMGRMNKGGIIEAAGRFGAKVCPRIRVKATGLVMIQQSASPADRCHFGRACGDGDQLAVGHPGIYQGFWIRGYPSWDL